MIHLDFNRCNYKTLLIFIDVIINLTKKAFEQKIFEELNFKARNLNFNNGKTLKLTKGKNINLIIFLFKARIFYFMMLFLS